MKVFKNVLLVCLFSLSLFSCRESTEMNTDGDMEESDSRTESPAEIE